MSSSDLTTNPVFTSKLIWFFVTRKLRKKSILKGKKNYGPIEKNNNTRTVQAESSKFASVYFNQGFQI